MKTQFFILLIGIAFIGCSGDDTEVNLTVDDNSIIGVKKATKQPNITIATETRHAYIKEVITYK